MERKNIIISIIIYLGLIFIFIIIAFVKQNGYLLNDKEYLVTKVIDGDTIEVVKDGQNYRVRYLGINTPEITHSDLPNDCYAIEAKELNQKLVLNKFITLLEDKQDKDKYGRLLRFVYLKTENISFKILESGAARSLIIPPNNKFSKTILEIENTAKISKLGLWGLCI